MFKATLLTFATLLGVAAPALAQVAPIAPAGAQWLGAQVNSRDSDTAYNDKSKVYLTVWGHPALYGRFFSESGTPLGPGQFLISAQSGSDAAPRVAYSSGSADDVFLVAFTSELENGVQQYMRSVRYTPDGPLFGPPQVVATTARRQHLTGGLAFNPNRRQFFYTWHSNVWGPYQAFGQLVQVSGSAAEPALTVIGTPINLSHSGIDLGTPNVAYDWKHDTYMVVYWSSAGTGIWARRVRFDPANNPTLDPPLTLITSGAPMEPNVAYMPEIDGFLTHWTLLGGNRRDVYARTVDDSAATGGSIFPVIARPSNEGAADADYSPYTRTILLTAMRDATMYIEGAELSAAGAFIRDFQASTSLPAPGMESLWPHTAVGDNGRFALSYINNFTNVWVDILQGPVVPGGAFPTPPTPPPPPCTSTLSTAAVMAPSFGGTASVGVSGACTWSAASGAPWIAIISGASGSGSGTVALAFSRNDTGVARTGSVTIAGQTVTVQQSPFVARAAIHDVSGDGLSDLVWHHQTAGSVAVWGLSGPNVVATYFVNSGPADLSWKLAGTGDLNGDGYADLIWRNSNGLVAAWLLRGPDVIATQLLMVAGDPNLVPFAVSEPDANWEVRAVGDLNGDGRTDLIWQHAADGRLATWFMNGFNIIGWTLLSVARQTDPNWKIAGAGDINADGRADIIWQHHATGALAAWLMNGSDVAGTGFLSSYSTDLNWKVSGVGDVNGDGCADLLWQHAGGALAVWYLNQFEVTYANFLSISTISDTNWKMVGPG